MSIFGIFSKFYKPVRAGREWSPECERALPVVPRAEIIVQIGALLPEISANPGAKMKFNVTIFDIFAKISKSLGDDRKWFPECKRARPAGPAAEIIVQIGALPPEISAPPGSLRVERQIMLGLSRKISSVEAANKRTGELILFRYGNEASDALGFVSIWFVSITKIFFEILFDAS